MTRSRIPALSIAALLAACLATPSMAQAPCDVKTAQEWLETLGFEPGPADGRMGPSTAKAIREFQEGARITASGALGAATCEALAEAVKRREGVGPGESEEPQAEQTYEQCIRIVVDRLLESRSHPIREYSFTAPFREKRFGGVVQYTSGSILYVGQDDEAVALTLFAQALSDYTNGLEWAEVKNEIERTCEYEST